jgi:hypothetical protein
VVFFNYTSFCRSQKLNFSFTFGGAAAQTHTAPAAQRSAECQEVCVPIVQFVRKVKLLKK